MHCINTRLVQSDVNTCIARAALGALWPLNPRELHGGTSRIRDIVSTVAADPCCKIVDVRTAASPAGGLGTWAWQDACKAVANQYPAFDVLASGRKVTTAGALLLARGFGQDGPGAAGTGVANGGAGGAAGGTLDPRVFVNAAGGHGAFVGWDMSSSQHVTVRQGSCILTPAASSGKAAAVHSTGAATGANTARRPPGVPGLTAICSRSSVVGLLGSTADRAASIWQAGAYLHWYAKHGCGQEAVRIAIESIVDVVDCYRVLHGIQDVG